ncbi:ABC transporter permease [Rathayibacter soli]|uniref:ABC transporter permease n=1 Tax=Rathayibacter soli TaxID=3144168 RepID=UPI0027E4DEE4|nr:ABC transporter permease subunit [Glaciibacter superstes]
MSWFWSNFDSIWQLTLSHVALSIPPILIGFALSVPIGWLANRYHATRGVLLSIGGLLYTIPSLALFVAMPSLIGTKILDPVNVIVALSIYGLALMVRTTADALAAVDGDVKQSATAVGFSGWRRFWAVDLPLAGPVLLAGVRVVSVSTVSLVSVGSIIGVSSLGNLFLDGYLRSFPEEILVGIIGTLIIAIVFDVILVLLGRFLMPWSHTTRTDRRRARAARSVVVSAS